MEKLLLPGNMNGWFKPKIFILLLSCLIALDSRAQTGIISGTVKDENSGELPGVNVFIKNTTTGTVTDINGSYSLEAPVDATLVFSSIGYEIKEIPINNQSIVDVTLAEDITSLEEIVIVGYGTQKKINLSGSVDQVDSKVLESRPINTLSQGLQGVIPNLNIDFVSGEPGQEANIDIRGFASINGGEPLIIIDDVPASSLELNRLAPSDVESISVLKDASSAAIFGARAAFGVIIVKTKSGSKEGVHISYSNNFAWAKPTILPDKITDPYIYLRLRETSTDNTPWDNQNYSDETYKWAKERSENPLLSGVRVNPNDASTWEYMGNRDWTDYFLDDYSFSQWHHVSVDGRTDKTQFYLSTAYDDQNGALKIAEDNFNRYNIRSKVNYHALKWLSIGNNTLLAMTQRNKPTYFDIWDIYNFHPTDWDKNPDGSWANTEVGQMGAKLTEGGNIEDKYSSFMTTFTTELSFWEKMLRINGEFTIRQGTNNYNRYWTKYDVGYGPEDIREVGINAAERISIFNTYNVLNLYATFNKDFAGHNLTGIVGFNQEFNRSDSVYAYRDKIISSSLPTIALATGDAFVDEGVREWAIRGGFFRLNYSFRNRYIVEFNGRYDGSSKFPKSDRFGFFPSASAAWRIDEESFMNSVDFISMLKLRSSYGALGNQNVEEYGYIPTMNAEQGDYIIDGKRDQKVSAPPLVSSNYTWEKVSTLNFGIDLGLFEHKLVAMFDVFSRDTEGMLTLGKELPAVLGASEPKENAADLRTQGWEFSLDYVERIQLGSKPLTIGAKLILSDSKTEITGFDNPNRILTQYYEGQQLGEIWGLQSDGLFQSEEEILNLDQSSLIPWGALSIVPGWPKYKDLDGNGVIEKGSTVDDPKDLSVIGNMTPRYRYGLDLNFSWNGFDLRAFFQGVGQRDYYPLDYLYWGFYQQPYAGGYTHLQDFYRGSADSDVDRAKHSQAYLDAGLADANTNAQYPILQAWLADRNLGERIDQSKGLAIPQTRYLLSASYLRFKNLTFGYTLPDAVTEKLHISRLRVFVSGENITEWSQVDKYYDPEAITDSNVKVDPGVNPSRTTGKGYAYPFSRRWSVGLNLNF
ncbi:MAG: TonB-dependent receptor [Cytophagales bacterium]|nr:TonB-dependent receptor [Cytophagales bacterium]